MKKIKYYIICALAMSLMGCANFLDVNPKGEVFDKDMFSSDEGYEDALYGIYAELGATSYLYSDYMFWVPETLCANVTISDDGMHNMAIGDWSKSNAPGIRSGIWKTAYTAINHINNIVNHIEKGGEHQFRYTQLYKGEALGLRALLHFDLLRMFGAPIWAPEAAKAKAIPYVSKYEFVITPISSVDQVYEMIIADLLVAEKCLAQDESLMPAERTNISNGGFASCRIIHMNLYAVQALLARVYWSKNDFKSAAIYAEKVIKSGKFGFRSTSAFAQPDNGALDLNETIFGLYSTVSQKRNLDKYRLKPTSGDAGFSMAADYRKIYEDGSASDKVDYRLAAWFDVGQSTLRKLVNSTYYASSDPVYRGKSILGINMLTLPEMYYIMAESLLTSNPQGATIYFDDVVKTRGLEPLTGSGVELTAENIYQERRKEFYGEGQHWFNMKRLGKDISITSTIIRPGNDPATFTFPLPTGETDYRPL